MSLSRNIMKVALLAVLTLGGWLGLTVYEKHGGLNGDFKAEHLKRLEAEAKAEQLKAVVSHLQSETRVADVLVTDQSQVDGKIYTTLLFQEYAKDGSPLTPKRFTIEGNEAHIDALVVKFQGKYVEGRDPLKGKSVALFTKLFGDKESPESGHVIDEPGHIPAVYKGADPQAAAFEQQLWQDFWKLAQDKGYREQLGVDVLQGKSVWWRFEPGFLYTITLQADADLNLRYEPLRPSIREMLRLNQLKTAPATQPIG